MPHNQQAERITKLKESIWPKVWLVIGIVLLVIYIGGMISIRHDFLTNDFYRYGSMPVNISYMLHSIFFLAPSVISLTVSFVLHRRKNK